MTQSIRPLILIVACLALSAPAWAQTNPFARPDVDALVAAPAEPGLTLTTATVLQAPSDRRYTPRVFGGLINVVGSSGFQIGGGVSASPFSNEQLEILGDVSYARVGTPDYSILGASTDTSVSLWIISGNLIYNFELADDNFTPYAGAGIAFTRGSASIEVNIPGFGTVFEDSIGGSDVNFQLLGGVELPMSSGRAFRGELRLLFAPGDTAVSLLAGIGF